MKKFLSLVLALVMTMSLVTVSAGAKDFTDDSSINYKEAVDVISAIGIVDGYADGSFGPDGALTRGAAAKIICNLILGPTTASLLSASTAPFKDVPTTNVFAGYITYCAQQGIINGYGDGTFRPSGTLTGNAFMKMLLGALGYDSSIEGYTGSNWAVNVIKQAAGIGLDDGNDEFVGSKAVTRQEAALYACNMLKAVMVEYDAKTTVNVNGATVTIAGDKASPVRWQTGVNNDGNIGTADGFIQFAEQYFDRLTLRGTTDDFGRPSNEWTWKGVKVGTYPKNAVATYTADTTLGTIYADLGMTSKDEEAEVYVDGVQADELAEVSRNNDLKVSKVVFNKDAAVNDPDRTCQVGNGTLIEAYRDDSTNDVTIVCINTYVAEVNKVVAASGNKPAYITLTELVAEKGNGYKSPLKSNDEFETTDFASDDIVLFTYADGEIQSVKAAESTEGELTRREVTKNVTLGENKYSFSNKYSVENTESSLNIGSSYEAYLDEYGYVIYMEESEYNIADYAFVRQLQSSTNAFESDKAALRDYMGKGQTVDLTRDYYTEAGGDFNNYGSGSEVAIGDDDALIALAREASDGDYRLKALTTVNYSQSGTLKTKDFSMQNGVARITLNDTTHAYVYADSRTQVVVGTYDVAQKVTWHAYSGANNMPTIVEASGTSPDSIQVSYYARSGNVATIMYILVSKVDYDVTAGNNDVVFFSPESASKYVWDASNDYYTFSGVVNGEIVTDLKVANNKAAAILVYNKNTIYNGGSSFDLAFTNVEYDDGVIVGWDPITDGAGIDGSFVATGVNKLSNGNLQLGYHLDVNGNTVYGDAGTYVVSNDVKVFFIDDDGVITTGSMSGVRRSDKDIVTVVLDDGQITYLFVQQYWDDENSNTPAGPSNGLSMSNRGILTFVDNTMTTGDKYGWSVEMIAGGTKMTVAAGSFTAAAGDDSFTQRVSLIPNTYYVATVWEDTNGDGVQDAGETSYTAYTLAD